MFDTFIKAATLAAVTFALVCSCAVRAHADETYPVALELTYQGIAAIDAAQTAYIGQHPERYHECNPLLGSHPSDGHVAAYFVAGGLLHAAVTAALPPRVARVWEYISIGFESGMVVHNYRIGIKLSVP